LVTDDWVQAHTDGHGEASGLDFPDSMSNVVFSKTSLKEGGLTKLLKTWR
jgi:hypothetical protein